MLALGYFYVFVIPVLLLLVFLGAMIKVGRALWKTWASRETWRR